MNEHEWLAVRFEEHRPHLRAVAYRMLGSLSEADDAVQDAWLRLSRSDASAIQNFRGWLTTAVARSCLNMLQSRRSRCEETYGSSVPEPISILRPAIGPEDQALITDSVGLALLVVLDKLAPAERVAFVLHDVFAMPFLDIAAVVGRSPAAVRQIASRARRRVQGSAVPDADLERQRVVVNAFLAASRGGDFEALVAVLDPEVLFRADESAVCSGSPREMRGAAAVARRALKGARGAELALVDGAVGLVVAPRRRLVMVLCFTIARGKIVEIEAIADPERLRQLDIVVLDE
jgi:RNA polymerase sigma factor (sigma-70 family)